MITRQRLRLLASAPFDYAAVSLFVGAAFALKCRDWINGHWRRPATTIDVDDTLAARREL